MIKIKLFFLVLFLFVFQLTFSYAQNADMMLIIMENNIEDQLLYENTSITQKVSGELQKNQFDALYNKQLLKCFLSNNNSKDFHFSIVQGDLLLNSVTPGHLFNSCLNKKVMNVPIYLQTEKIRL
ncbi:MAG TPA: hypothetical protein VI413_10700 [Paludibacter sp.]